MTEPAGPTEEGEAPCSAHLLEDGDAAGAVPLAGVDELAVITSLGEPTRRALYDHVVTDGGWVSRDEAAEALGLGRGTAAHHLERLADDGLLEVDYQRRSGRQGPGAGRPAKLYRRAGRDFDVSLPPRDYELAGRVLADAVDAARTKGTDIAMALSAAAAAEGRRLAGAVRDRLRGDDEPATRRRAVLDALLGLGYEPVVCDDGTIALRNCPFDHLSQHHTELICGMNLTLLDAAVHEVDRTGLRAALEPGEGSCCVRLHLEWGGGADRGAPGAGPMTRATAARP